MDRVPEEANESQTPIVHTPLREAPVERTRGTESIERLNRLLTAAVSLATSIHDAEFTLPILSGVVRTRQLLRTLAVYVDIDGKNSNPLPTQDFPTPEELATAATVSAPLTYATVLASQTPAPPNDSPAAASAAPTMPKKATPPTHTPNTAHPKASRANTARYRPRGVGVAKVKDTSLSQAAPRPLSQNRLILRFSSPLTPEKLARCQPHKLCQTINVALAGAARIRGANVTRSGNVILHAEAPYSAAHLERHSDCILSALQDLWDGLPPPSLDSDTPWHSVVIQRAPLFALLHDNADMPVPEANTLNHIVQELVDANEGLQSSGIKRMKWLAKQEDYTGKVQEMHKGKLSSISLRVDLCDEKVAKRLLEDGVFVGGTHCRVARYQPRKTRL